MCSSVDPSFQKLPAKEIRVPTHLVLDLYTNIKFGNFGGLDWQLFIAPIVGDFDTKCSKNNNSILSVYIHNYM